jgi:ATP-dependent RNA helicase DDX52/ROK1
MMNSVEYLIMDEADRLFDLGFAEQIDDILGACSNPKMRKAIFSATIPQGVEVSILYLICHCTWYHLLFVNKQNMVKTIMSDPIRVTVGKRYVDSLMSTNHSPSIYVLSSINSNAATSRVHQKLVFVGTEDGKLLALRQLIQNVRFLALPLPPEYCCGM